MGENRSSIDAGVLQPFLSVVVLYAPDGDTTSAAGEVLAFLRAPASPRSRGDVVLIAEGLTGSGSLPWDLERVVPLVHRVHRSPSWQTPDGVLTDVIEPFPVAVLG